MSYCLVTGAAGFIGSHLVDALLKMGHGVVGVDDLSTGHIDNVTKHKKYRFVHGSDAHPNWWRGTDDWDVVFHCAARPRIPPSFNNPADTLRNNFGGVLEMMELARASKARFIYAGSSTCDSDVYANPYALSKHMGEDLCHLYTKVFRVPCAIARFYNVYGPRQIESGPYATAMGIWEKAHREGQPLPMCGTGEKRRDWTHVEDVVSGLMAIDEWLKRNEVLDRAALFHLGAGCDVSVAEVLEMFGGEIGHLLDRPGEAQVTLADNERERRLLCWEPKWRIEDYIKTVKENTCREQKCLA